MNKETTERSNRNRNRRLTRDNGLELLPLGEEGDGGWSCGAGGEGEAGELRRGEAQGGPTGGGGHGEGGAQQRGGRHGGWTDGREWNGFVGSASRAYKFLFGPAHFAPLL